MDKMLVQLVARGGKLDALAERLPGLAKRWADSLRAAPVRATVMLARADDPLRRSGDYQSIRHAFDASVEIKLDAPDAAAHFGRVARGLGEELEPLIHADLSAVQLGTNKPFMDFAPAPIRYQYCMRRRHDFTHAAYLKRYEEIHSQFGLKTKGIEGYCQFHIDAAATARVCVAAGLGVSRVSSVSELHIATLETFFAAGSENAKLGAQADEDEFVDRAHSVMWISDEVFRLGY